MCGQVVCEQVVGERVVCVCVSVNHLKRCKTSMFRSRFHDFEFLRCDFMSFSNLNQKQGAQAHCGYLCQRSYSTMGEAEIDHLRVPAIFHRNGKGLSQVPQKQQVSICCTVVAI